MNINYLDDYKMYVINPNRYKGYDNLIAYWRLNGDAFDYIGDANGALNGDTTYSSGLYGQAASMTNMSSGINIPDDDKFTFADGTSDKPFSLSFLINWRSLSNINIFFNKRDQNASGEWQISYNPSGTSISFVLFNNNTNNVFILARSTVNLSLNTWYHIVATYNGSGSQNGLNIYLNGSLLTSIKSMTGIYVKMNNSISPVRIGDANVSTNDGINGLMMGVGIWDKELNSSDVSDIYNKQIISHLV